MGVGDVITTESDPHEAILREGLGDLMTGIDPTGFEIVRLLRAVGNQYAQEAATAHDGVALSGPRWLLLLRLYVEEGRGQHPGLPPSYLSRCQDVTRNTISVLLRGLEEQGWIERRLDPDDRRVFRIRLTAAGRELIRATAPARLAHLNYLIDGLSPEERRQLVRLLTKLHRSLTDRSEARATAEGAQP
jgi:DNA-binding MarR family transcriptional regulator